MNKLWKRNAVVGAVLVLVVAAIVLNGRYAANVAEQEEAGNTFVIRPPRELRISRTANDPEELNRIYRMGRHTAKKYLNRIKEFMADV